VCLISKGEKTNFNRFWSTRRMIFYLIFGAFLKLPKAVVSFFTSVRLSTRPHEATRLRLGWFLWNFIFGYFSKICQKNWKFMILIRIPGTLRKDLCTFIITSLWILPRMRNISDNICSENQNTHFTSNKFFLPKIVPFIKDCGNIT
jgi:hypothetical protein